MATAEGYLRRLTRRLTEDPEQLDVEALSDEAVNTGAMKAINCQRGQEVTMIGTLRSVETCGKGGASGVRAELFDGSDTVTLVWLGQRRIPGIDSGRTLRVRGRGVPASGSRAHGDLLVTVDVAVPSHLGPEEKEAVSKLATVMDGDSLRSAEWGDS